VTLQFRRVAVQELVPQPQKASGRWLQIVRELPPQSHFFSGDNRSSALDPIGMFKSLVAEGRRGSSSRPQTATLMSAWGVKR